ncbi:VCBS repeat-containing protein [Flavobacteriaceae bacterium D16]|nr:VCBS repeat-containing protein [Flavobacteriaceae bacterium D16]
MKKSLLLALAGVLFFSCGKDSERTSLLFNELKPAKTGISFTNTLTESDSLNYFTYGYLYMGGGVAAGDFNNDGLTDLYFTGNQVPNALYLNKGDLQFENIAEQAGVDGDQRWYTGVTLADVNSDGFLDIYCSVSGKFGPMENQLFINNGDLSFSEQAAAYGLAEAGNNVQSTFFDYDKDGDLDVYIANYPPTAFNAPNSHYKVKQQFPKPLEMDKLMRNDGHTFTDVTEEAGLKTFGLSLSATVGDLNEDGWPDLYISNDFSSPDYCYINNKNGTFSERVRTITKNTSFYGMGVDIADFNNDGLLDIFQADMTANDNRRSKANMASMNPQLFWSTVNSGFHFQYMQNSLQMNNGNLLDSLPDFSNVTRLAGVSSTDWSWGPLMADLDNDGWKDLFISNGTRREINNRDYFLAWEAEGRPMDNLLQRSLDIPSEPIDNFVYRNTGDLRFEQVNESWGIVKEGFSNGAVYVDLDNDGDLEIVINNLDDTASLFENKGNVNHYLQLVLNGPEKNPNGLGARVYVHVGGLKQMQELTLSRGFQSAVSPRLHFGLGSSSVVDTLQIIWPDGKKEIRTNLEADKLMSINYQDATLLSEPSGQQEETQFDSKDNSLAGMQFQHQENYYDDFINEILLPHRMSMFGPYMAKGDLNGDEWEDIIVGGASGQPTQVFMGTPDGFTKKEIPELAAYSEREDMGIAIFDIDGDGQDDLYISSGGNEFGPDSAMLQDRVYLNDGGSFTEVKEGIADFRASASVVVPFDFDKDGDLDVLVGSRVIPGNYPSPASSYLLENRSTPGNPVLVDVTAEKASMLIGIGLLTRALPTDYDGDGWTDLLLGGEWMPLVLLKNEEGSFKDVSEVTGLADTRAWWFGLGEGDFDGDGDMDYLAGNLGLNYKYKASETETFDVYYDDFDASGTKDIVLSYYNYGEKFPVRGRECSSQQMPAIKKKFEDYASFSTATLADVYTQQALDESLHYQVKSFASVYLENTPEGFVIRELPIEAQISSINDILIDDIDGDGNLDAVVAGNLYTSEVETPRNDASNGLFLKGDGDGGFKPVVARKSGLYIPGDVKNLLHLNRKDGRYFLVGKNNDSLQLIRVNEVKKPDVMALK